MPPITLSMGLTLLRKKAYKTVHEAAIKAIKADVKDSLPYFLLGVIASEHDNYAKALDLFSTAIGYDPSVIDYHVHHAKILSTLGRQNAAKASADKAAALAPKDVFSLDTLGVIYSRAGYHELAVPLFEKAVSLKPNSANYHYNLAASAQFMGAFDKAKIAYDNTLALDPKFYRAWSSLVSLAPQTLQSNHLETLTALFEQAENDAEGRLQLGHAIAKTLEDLGRHEESLTWLLRGKADKRAQLRYERESGAAIFAAAKSTSTTTSTSTSTSTSEITPRPAQKPCAASPIFIIGLPRTGTTLVDRILSSHSQVISAGELNMFAELVKEKAGTASNLVMDEATLRQAAHLDLSTVGQDYITNTQDRAKGSKHMVDKMPLNFFYAGLIHRALPHARIIALRRGAMDSCLSNFRQLFSTQYSYYNYTFDLEDTAWFYRKFDDLMSVWRRRLPQDRFMEIHYEDIVFDQENQTRRLLEFCGLTWEEACLRFHENTAPVSTASSVQVRQPLYSGSIGRWKKYGSALHGLKTALGDLAP